MSRISEHEKQEAREALLEILHPGDTVYCILRHVSRSGMYRVISLYVIKDNQPYWISYQASKLLEGFDNRHEGCRATGCGMDMGFHLVYSLGYQLWPNGFTCSGEHCPSNDHSNKPWPERDGQMFHNSGGYALHHRWM